MIQVSLTVDDLPRHGDVAKQYDPMEIVSMILEQISTCGLPPTCGFVNGMFLDKYPLDKLILEKWVKSGGFLGNHTYSHFDLRDISGKEYINDILKNEPVLNPFSRKCAKKFFRHPFLLEGETEEKFSSIRTFLKANHYQVVPVTMDYWDYIWNRPVCNAINSGNSKALAWLKKSYIDAALERFDASVNMSRKVFGRDIKHVLLVHLGIATALFLGDVIKEYQRKGCEFIDLDDALTDEAYMDDPILITDKGPNFLLRSAITKNIREPWPHIDKHALYKTVELL